jgi:tRNA (guanine37-N1)-methyltransferase
MLKLDFVTLFPEVIEGPMRQSIVHRAVEKGLFSWACTNPRDFATDSHNTVDDAPFGGSPGMLMRCPELHAAMESLSLPTQRRVVVFEPSGSRFTQSVAKDLSQASHVAFVCGHYEGIDQRITDRWATDVLSLGDFVLTGGELPALVVADAIIRLLGGALGNAGSLEADSHSDGLLSYPQWTRPADFMGARVPGVLLSGNHGEIHKWRRSWQLRQTRTSRPDLFCTAPLSKEDLTLL